MLSCCAGAHVLLDTVRSDSPPARRSRQHWKHRRPMTSIARGPTHRLRSSAFPFGERADRTNYAAPRLEPLVAIAFRTVSAETVGAQTAAPARRRSHRALRCDACHPDQLAQAPKDLHRRHRCGALAMRADPIKRPVTLRDWSPSPPPLPWS